MRELKTQDVGDARLPYLYYEGETPAIIFVHATGFLPWLWEPVIEKIIPQRRSWAPFFCNYRPADPEKDGLNWQILASDLAVFRNKLNIKKPLLVGHSMGATVSVMAEAFYGLDAAGMILIEPIFLPEAFYATNLSLQNHPLAAKAIKRLNSWPDEQAAWDYLCSKELFADWDERVLKLYHKFGMQKQEDGSIKLTCSPASEAALFMGGRLLNPWPLLTKITCPVLVLEGEKTGNKQFVDIQKIVSLLHKGAYQEIPTAGHLIPMQQPAEIARVIMDFTAKTQKK